MSAQAVAFAAGVGVTVAAYALWRSRSTLKQQLAGATLHFFPLSGRAEATRLALTIGGIPFEDRRFQFAEWGKLKPTTQWATVPVLELRDGTRIGQARSILRLVGKATGLYPSEPLLAQLNGSVVVAQVHEASFGRMRPELHIRGLGRTAVRMLQTLRQLRRRTRPLDVQPSSDC